MFLAVFTMSFFLEWVLQNYPSLLWGFFFGLVAASVLTVGRRVKRWGLGPILGIVIGAVGAFVLVGLAPVETPETWWFFFLSGAVVISAMVLPGFSGSFVLVLLGKYERLLSAVTDVEVLILFWVIAGAAVGIVTVAQLLSWLFKRYHDGTVAVLAGMLIGSLRKIWPWRETLASGFEKNVLPEFSGQVVLTILLALFGFALIIGLTMWAAQREYVEE
jgi:putative membrane protein